MSYVDITIGVAGEGDRKGNHHESSGCVDRGAEEMQTAGSTISLT